VSLDEEPRKRRMMDHSNADARRAIAHTLGRFNDWRLDLARFQGMAERRFTEMERLGMLERCADIEGELMLARTDLIVGLADAPQKVAGHSRVVDVERALDNISTAVDALRKKLTQ
jgi:hypothetical protein